MADRPVGQLADDRRWRRLTTVAIAAGAIWRLGRLALVKWHQPLLFNDSVYYSEQAKLLTRGLWYREVYLAEGLPGAEHGPLTSTLLAPVSWVHDPVPWQRLVTSPRSAGSPPSGSWPASPANWPGRAPAPSPRWSPPPLPACG